MKNLTASEVQRPIYTTENISAANFAVTQYAHVLTEQIINTREFTNERFNSISNLNAGRRNTHKI